MLILLLLRRSGGHPQLFFGFSNNPTQRRQNVIGQWIGLVGLEDVARLFERPLMDILAARRRPSLPHSAVDQLGLGLGFHVLDRAGVTEEIVSDTDFTDGFHGQRLTVHRNPLQDELDHPGEFIVHDQLAEIDCHAHFDHPKAVNQVGTCQRRQQAREGFFVTGLGIT